MTTDTHEVHEADAHSAVDDAHEHGFSDMQYVKVAAILAVITALEVYASYADWLGRAFIPLLLFMMAVKFISVVLYFMHLKFDAKIYSWCFYIGIGTALAVYIGTLLTFHFFNS